MMRDRDDEKGRLSTSDIAAAANRDPHDLDAVDAGRTDRTAVQGRQQRSTPEDAPSQLFSDDDASGYRTRWGAIQTGFVDEPRQAVEQADLLVAEVMKRLAEVFSDERQQLERQWERADQVSTEDLRLAMRRYRSFFERLLSV